MQPLQILSFAFDITDSDAGEQEESDLGEEEEDEDDDDDENGDPSLADVYNDISDDNSDYVEEADGEHYSDGEEVEEEEEDEDENDGKENIECLSGFKQ